MTHVSNLAIDYEVVATGLAPTQCVLALFDPVLHVASTVVDLDHLSRRKPRFRDNEPDSWKKLSHVPLDLGDHPEYALPCPYSYRQSNRLPHFPIPRDKAKRNAPGPTTPWLPSWKKHGDHHKDINELYLSMMNADFLAVVPRRRHNAAEANYGGDTPWRYAGSGFSH